MPTKKELVTRSNKLTLYSQIMQEIRTPEMDELGTVRSPGGMDMGKQPSPFLLLRASKLLLNSE